MDLIDMAGRRLELWQKNGPRITFVAAEDRDQSQFTARLDPEINLGDLILCGFQLCQVSDLRKDPSTQTFRLKHVCCYWGNP